MGLLDDLMGQLTGAAASDSGRRPQSNTGAAMAALLPIVLAMLRGSGSQSQAGPQPSGGGLGDILSQVLGGSGSSSGGLGALLERFQAAGYGQQARSWVSTGQNQSLPSGALEQVFGRDALAEIARRAGLSERETSQGLSQLMPEVIDRVTPGGEVPPANSLLASVDAFARQLGA
jgi:uncharacterized protein YidB (DUF937 family)